MDSIAIVGMSGRFPGADSIDALWKNLVEGVESIERGGDDPDPNRVRARGRLADVAGFDPDFFGFTPREAALTDPQQRIFLECAQEALERAAIDPGRFDGSVGVFAGQSLNTYLLHNLRDDVGELIDSFQTGHFHVLIGNDKDYLATRVAHRLDLRGPAITVQTACSTSLVAVAQACQALLTWQCDAALAGGVSISFPDDRSYLADDGGLASTDGRCRPFDAAANGTVFGAGAGVVVLRRLRDAMADGDFVWAVIKGVAVNNDGAVKLSYMAPSVEGQAEVIAQAQALADVEPESIGYVEAHGTATPLGDPIEVKALTQAFRQHTDRRGYCGLGSIKGNLGHLETAAGVTGLIKAVLAVHHAVIPPTLHFEAPNPLLDLDASPFFVVREKTPWPLAGPRRAAVSSFGLGGTNAHAILEEAPPCETDAPQRAVEVLPLSARTPTALQTLTDRMATWLRDNPDACRADVAHTLQTGRAAQPWRSAIVDGEMLAAVQALDTPRVAFMFPGQGAQHVNMGRDLYGREPVFRAAVDHCRRVLQPLLDLDLRDVLFPTEGEEAAAEARLRETWLTQPAIFTIEYATARLWMSWGVEPAACIGHSVGEYVAAVVCGAIAVEDALGLLVRRARLMHGMAPGGMLAVRLSEDGLRARLPEGVSIAAINGPDACVAAGPHPALEILREALEAEDIACKLLATSHAFHSAMMDPLENAFDATIEWRAPRIPYVSSLTGTWIGDDDRRDARYWFRHLREPVRFADGMRTLAEAGTRIVLEVGPGQTLAASARRATDGSVVAIASLPGADENEQRAMLTALGRLWCHGVAVDWKALRGDERRRRIPLPTSPFERQRCWVEAPAAAGAPGAANGDVGKELTRPPNGTVAVAGSAPSNGTVAAAGNASGNGTVAAAGSAPSNGTAAAAGNASSNGAVAAAGFAAPAAAGIAASPATAAASRVETLVAEVAALFTELSGAPCEVGDGRATFVDLGLDSLLLTRASLALRKRFGAQVTFRQLLGALNSPRALAVHLDATLAAAAAPAPAAPSPSSLTLPAEGLVEHARPRFGPFKALERGAEGGLTARQQQALDALTARYNRRTAKSKEMAQKHRAHFCDPRAAGGFRQLWKEMVYPIVAARSSGSRIVDIDGNEYVDVTMGFGANFLGHNPPYVTAAVSEQLARGVEIGPQHFLAGEVAEGICALTGMDRATFCNTGSEAVMAALRVARTVTGRDKFVYFGGDYHGIFDEVLAHAGERDGRLTSVPIAPGIPPESLRNVIVLPYGSAASLQALQQIAGEVAAVLVEPVQARHPAVQPREFLQDLRRITREAEICLIFDEVITGFRCHPGGAQAWFDVAADLATYGKVIGGGMPIGVLAGRKRFMDALDGGMWQFGDDSFPEVGVTFFAGTFVRHPLAMAAAHAVLTHLRERGPALQEEAAARCARFVDTLNDWLAARALPMRLERFTSTFYYDVHPDLTHAPLLFYYLRDRGVHIWEGRVGFFSTAHSEADVDFLIDAFQHCVTEMQAAGFLPDSAAADGLVGPVERPLTAAQREIWLACQMGAPASAAYVESIHVRLDGPLDVERLRAAVVQTVQQHEALRATFDPAGTVQRIAPVLALEVPLVDLSSLPDDERRDELDAHLEEEGRVGFDLVAGPLVRSQIVRLAPESHVLVLSAHHIVCDGWSVDVILSEISARCSDRPVEAPMQFGDYQAWLDDASDEVDAAVRWWRARFEGRPAPRLDLVTAAARPPHKTYNGSCSTTVLPAPLAAALRQTATAQGVTLFNLMLAAFYGWLRRLGGGSEIVVGVPIAGQLLAGGDDLVGHCAHLLPVLARLDDAQSFAAFARDVQDLMADASEHGLLSFGTLVERLGLPRDASRTPLVSVTFNIDPPMQRLSFRGLQHAVDVNPRAHFQFDLGLNIVDERDGMIVQCNHNSDLFSAAAVEEMLAMWTTLLQGVVDDPARPLGRLPLVGEPRRSALLERWRPALPTHGPTACLHEQFAAQAARVPHRAAVTCGAESLTYAALDARANRLAHLLRGCGVGRGSLVGLYTERSLDTVIGIVATMKAGAAYVPMDTVWPRQRLAFVIEDAAPAVVLTQVALRDALPETVHAICMDTAASALTEGDPSAPDSGATRDDLAYVIYTSGSTGTPKGTRVTHANAAWLFAAAQARFGFTEDDVWTLFHSQAFDFSVWEMWGALLHGGHLVVVSHAVSRSPRQFHALLAEHRVTVLNQTPSAFRMLVPVALEENVGLALRYVIFGGEALDTASLRAWMQRFGTRAPQLVNGYGITETTVFETFHWLTRDDVEGPVAPIGTPLAGSNLYVVDAAMEPVPPLVPGELIVSGCGVARGYLNRPELTAARFIEDPFLPGVAAYRSGDLVRARPDGELEFLGRIDAQVKIRGYRIEPGEIETALRACAGVTDCAVVAAPGAGGEMRLVAYVVPSIAAPPSTPDLRVALARTLPEYMVPTAFCLLERLPLTSNGKLDRASLPTPSLDEGTTARYVAPRTPAEASLVALFEEVLERREVGVDDDFFDSGGHSMLAVRLFARVEEVFGRRLPLSTLFAAPTAAGLAHALERQEEATRSTLVEIQPRGTQPPFIWLHTLGGGGGGGLLRYRDLASKLGDDQPSYGLEAPSDPFHRIEDMAAHYIERLRTLQPHGPYTLGGYCFGGVVAYEMACRLMEEGETVAFLAVLEADAPIHARAERGNSGLLGNLSARLGDFWMLPPQQQVKRLKRKAGQLARALTGRSAAPRLEDYVDMAEYPADYRRFAETHWAALMAYEPRPYHGRLTLFRVAAQPLHTTDPTLQWKALVTGGVDVHVVPGAHENILEPPHVDSLAAQISSALRRARREPQPRVDRDAETRTLA